jgi:hypothetical protein
MRSSRRELSLSKLLESRPNRCRSAREAANPAAAVKRVLFAEQHGNWDRTTAFVYTKRGIAPLINDSKRPKLCNSSTGTAFGSTCLAATSATTKRGGSCSSKNNLCLV